MKSTSVFAIVFTLLFTAWWYVDSNNLSRRDPPEFPSPEEIDGSYFALLRRESGEVDTLFFYDDKVGEGECTWSMMYFVQSPPSEGDSLILSLCATDLPLRCVDATRNRLRMCVLCPGDTTVPLLGDLLRARLNHPLALGDSVLVTMSTKTGIEMTYSVQ